MSALQTNARKKNNKGADAETEPGMAKLSPAPGLSHSPMDVEKPSRFGLYCFRISEVEQNTSGISYDPSGKFSVTNEVIRGEFHK